jgi:hypothetical protein
LIAALNKAYPARCARKGMTMEEAMFEAGQRDVIERLLFLKAEQDKNILETPTL